MKYELNDGTVVAEEYFEQLSEKAAQGDYPGAPGEWIVRPQGRPRLAEEDLVTIAFKVPRSQREALDERASQRNETRSQFMREVLLAALAG